MAFWAKKFIFNNIPSEIYNLSISSSGGQAETDAPSDITMYTESIYRRSKPYLLGVTQDKVLTFPVEFRTPYELTTEDFSMVSKWLFGQTGYKELRIVQYDMQDLYFNCYFVEPKIIRIGNIIRGVSATAICDAPWGWSPEYNSLIYQSYPAPAMPIIFNNRSDNNFYLYPRLSILINGAVSMISIVNASDNNREFKIDNIPGTNYGTFTFDNDLQIATSSGGMPDVLALFNKKWLRFIPGINELTVSGTGTAFALTLYYTFAKKMG